MEDENSALNQVKEKADNYLAFLPYMYLKA